MCSQDDDPTTYDAPPRLTCEAKVGYAESPYGQIVRHCGQSVGLVTFTDHTGIQHRTCREHEAGMRSLWPEHPRVIA